MALDKFAQPMHREPSDPRPPGAAPWHTHAVADRPRGSAAHAAWPWMVFYSPYLRLGRLLLTWIESQRIAAAAQYLATTSAVSQLRKLPQRWLKTSFQTVLAPVSTLRQGLQRLWEAVLRPPSSKPHCLGPTATFRCCNASVAALGVGIPDAIAPFKIVKNRIASNTDLCATWSHVARLSATDSMNSRIVRDSCAPVWLCLRGLNAS